MSLKAEIIKRAYEVKDTVKAAIDEAFMNREKVKSVWNNYKPKPKKDLTVGAVDGSKNYREFLGYIVYAIGSTSSLFINGKLDSKWESFTVDVDIMKPHEFSEARLRILMGLIEGKEVLKILRENHVDCILLDGSITGNIIRPAVFNFELKSDEKRELWEIFNDLKGNFSLASIGAKEFYGEIAKTFNPKKFAAACGYLEYLEYLYTLAKLISEYGNKVVSISKTSISKLYGFNSLLPDIAVFNSQELNVGFSNPVSVKMDKEMKGGFPQIFEDVFRSFEIKTCFAKFSPNENVYKVETNIDIKHVMDVLAPYIVSGYPYPLRKVHEDVKIDKSDMENVISILGIRERTGREGLGE